MGRAAMMGRWLVLGLGLMGCSEDVPSADAGSVDDAGVDGAVDDAGPRDASRPDGGGPGIFLDAAIFEYDYACTGEVPAAMQALGEAPDSECGEGIWPSLPQEALCPTMSDASRVDPDTGAMLPPEDERPLPLEVSVAESGSFREDGAASYPETLKVVTWNMRYTSNLDAQIEALTTEPAMRDADVYLLNEVDRCSTRNGVRRAARMLAERIGGDYVYAVEFVELSIGRDIGGDTGQAIVSRRPLSTASSLCHSQHYDWFADEDEPRLGQRITLHADVPAGDAMVRLWAVHFESADLLGERRVVQAKELLDAAQGVACERPQIVAGDFNAWYPGAPELVVFRSSGFVEAMDVLGRGEGTHSSGRRLDYLFSRGFEVLDGGVLRDVGGSDHTPIWATLRLN